MEETEMKKKGNRVALAFLALGVIFGIIHFISSQKWTEIKLPEPVTLSQKFPVTNVELVVDEVALHFYKDNDVAELYKESFLKETMLAKKIYANYNILIMNGNINNRVGIFYFWRHPGGWMERYIEPFLSPPPIKNIVWKLKKVSLNETRDGVKLFYTTERSNLAISGIIRKVSKIASIGFFIIAVVIWFLVNF